MAFDPSQCEARQLYTYKPPYKYNQISTWYQSGECVFQYITQNKHLFLGQVRNCPSPTSL